MYRKGLYFLTLLIMCLLLPQFIFADTIETVAVLLFEPTIISEEETSMLTDIFENRLAATKKFNLVERNRIDKIMEELRFSLSDFTDESATIKLGRLLSAKWIVMGTVGLLGREYFFTIKLVNTETGLIVSGVSGEAKNLSELKKAVEKAAISLSTHMLTSFTRAIGLSASSLISEQEIHSIGLSVSYVRSVYNKIAVGAWASGYMRVFDKKLGLQGGGKIILGDPRAFALALNLGTLSSASIYMNRWYIEFIPLMLLGIPDTFGIGFGYSF